MNPFQFKTAGTIISGRHEAGNVVDHLLSTHGRVGTVLVVSQPSIRRSGFLDQLSADLRKRELDVNVSRTSNRNRRKSRLFPFISLFRKRITM